MNNHMEDYMEHLLELLHEFLLELLHFAITPIEIMGVFIILISSARAFYFYVKSIVFTRHVADHKLKRDFARHMGIALEFLLAAELLKTLVIGSSQELLILGVIMAMRIAITVLLHWEMKSDHVEVAGH